MTEIYLLSALWSGGRYPIRDSYLNAAFEIRNRLLEGGISFYPLLMGNDLSLDMRYFGCERGESEAILILTYTPATFKYASFASLLRQLEKHGTARLNCYFIELNFQASRLTELALGIYDLLSASTVEELSKLLKEQYPSATVTLEEGRIFFDGKEQTDTAPDPEQIPFFFLDGEDKLVPRKSPRAPFDGEDEWLEYVRTLPQICAEADEHINAAGRRLCASDPSGASAELALANERYGQNGGDLFFLSEMVREASLASEQLGLGNQKAALEHINKARELYSQGRVGEPSCYTAIFRELNHIAALAYNAQMAKGDFSSLSAAIDAMEQTVSLGCDMRAELAYALTQKVGEEYESGEEFSYFSVRSCASRALEIYEELLAEGREINRACYASVCSVLGKPEQ